MITRGERQGGKFILRDQALTQLKDLHNNHDTEVAHRLADAILCDFITSLGYPDVADAFEKLGKWYA